MYIIRCRVSGGVTGTRESVVKGKDGNVVRFATREEAEQKAAEYRRSVGRYSTADFRYWVDEEVF